MSVKHSFEIFTDYGHDNSLIFKAGTTCYRSEEKTKRTPEDFVKMFKKNGHTAMLEFSWFPIIICSNIENPEYHERDTFNLYEFFLKQKYFEVTIINGRSPNNYALSNKDYLIVSANGRAWLELFQNFYTNEIEDCVFSIYEYLHKSNPVLFDENPYCDDDIYDEEVLNYYKIKLCTFFPEYGNIRDLHDWVMVKFYGVSRGMTTELIRHRIFSYAQASTRYISFDNFEFIYPPSFDDLIETDKYLFHEVKEHIEYAKKLYQKLIDSGLKKQNARQILPIGIANEICVAGRLKDWKDMFKLRTAKNAHWEIRSVMTEVQEEFKKRGLM